MPELALAFVSYTTPRDTTCRRAGARRRRRRARLLEGAGRGLPEKYGVKYDKAVACLTRDRDALLAFFDLPAEHWDHLRTANPIESVFATSSTGPVRTKGALSQKTAKLMVFTLCRAASKKWRRLMGANLVRAVAQGQALGTLLPALEEAERRIAALRAKVEANRPRPVAMPENLPALYRAHIDTLVATLNKDEIAERAADERKRPVMAACTRLS